MKLKPYNKTKFITTGTLANNFLYETKIKIHHHDKLSLEVKPAYLHQRLEAAPLRFLQPLLYITRLDNQEIHKFRNEIKYAKCQWNERLQKEQTGTNEGEKKPKASTENRGRRCMYKVPFEVRLDISSAKLIYRMTMLSFLWQPKRAVVGRDKARYHQKRLGPLFFCDLN
jgi:hypothetical protein